MPISYLPRTKLGKLLFLLEEPISVNLGFYRDAISLSDISIAISKNPKVIGNQSIEEIYNSVQKEMRKI